jgi:uroporphyrinogen decarboxylase
MNDRFLRACLRQSVDTTPVWFMRQAGRSLPEYRMIRQRASLLDITRDPALCAEVTLQPVTRLGVDAAILFADITTPLAGIGVAVDIADGIGPIIEPPIRSAADIERLRPFDPAASIGPLLEAIRLVRRESPVPLIGFAGAPFTLASYLVEGRSSPDAARLKTMLHAEPEAADRLLERLVDMTVAYLAAQVGAGVQAVQLFDSWVGALSPFDYERSVAPHMRRLFGGLGDLGVPVIHFGTGSAGLLRPMAAAGGDVIGLDWRIGLDEGWALVGERAVQGNLDPSLLRGPFDAVADQARWVLDQAAGRPGHIFNLGHGVPPEADPDDLRRLVDLVHEVTARREPGASLAPRPGASIAGSLR